MKSFGFVQTIVCKLNEFVNYLSLLRWGKKCYVVVGNWCSPWGFFDVFACVVANGKSHELGVVLFHFFHCPCPNFLDVFFAYLCPINFLSISCVFEKRFEFSMQMLFEFLYAFLNLFKSVLEYSRFKLFHFFIILYFISFESKAENMFERFLYFFVNCIINFLASLPEIVFKIHDWLQNFVF